MDEENFDEHDTSGTLEDPNFPKMDGTPEDPTSPEMVGTHEDPSSPKMDGTSEETISPENEDPEKELGVEVRKWPGWPGENIFRMLIPTAKIGSIIGKKGEFIKKMCEETKARIKILEVPSFIKETVVLVSAKEEPSLTLSPAMKGLLAVHAHIVAVTSDQHQPEIVFTRLLVAAMQTGSIIGKQGGIIKSIQDESDCRIRVLEENLPTLSLKGDKVVDIQGKPQNVHKAVELIITHLRKFLAHRSIVQVLETQMKMLIDQADQNMPSLWGEAPQVFPNAGAEPSIPPCKLPPHQYSNYYPPAYMPDNKPQRVLSYGRDGLMGVSTPSAQPQQSFIGKTMQIHLSHADAIIGNSGATISYIRRASGATICIHEMGIGMEQMNVEINGSASQVQAAQQLIQNVIEGAQIPSAEAPPTGQDFAGYPSYDRYGYGTNNTSRY